mmetsp:Transcript_16467/g.38117  ORF Transcript_16467/g.38117 Transcript_16467/m.38117 type:complete len:201 (-) Transcript_16467:1638-2240(-)
MSSPPPPRPPPPPLSLPRPPRRLRRSGLPRRRRRPAWSPRAFALGEKTPRGLGGRQTPRRRARRARFRRPRTCSHRAAAPPEARRRGRPSKKKGVRLFAPPRRAPKKPRCRRSSRCPPTSSRRFRAGPSARRRPLLAPRYGSRRFQRCSHHPGPGPACPGPACLGHQRSWVCRARRQARRQARSGGDFGPGRPRSRTRRP